MPAMKQPRAPFPVRACAPACLGLLIGGLSACTTPTAYATLMEMRKQECRKLPDLAERARCEKEAGRSYDRYQDEAEAGRRSP
ncbi:MAG: hypothetical protein C0505_15130 [Leptothrix sp. (in: Bacteria)]|nr:hypothetical protein [Leptothrix sp. (in: b-proteobacteria)]